MSAGVPGWLLGLAPFERTGMRPGLERIQHLLAALGHPEAGLRIVRVGGTNGKGSVAALVEAILRAAGLRTGLYTSPHLLDPVERIRIGGAPVAPEALGRHAERVRAALPPGGATFFEAMTALALLAFREASVDLAVLEVGLGGRLDATNVGPPGVTVLTQIAHDHQELLGARLEDIAAEKAALIRGGVAATAAQAPEALSVVEARCRALGVPLWVEGRELAVGVHASDLGGHRLDVAGPGWTVRDLQVALPGLFQPGNTLLAVAAIHLLAPAYGLAVPEAAVRAGCAGIRWPGRFQVVAGEPPVILDGAHNPAGAAALAASLAHHFPGARVTCVVGVSRDKDRAGILKALTPVATRLVLTAAANPRATPPGELRAHLPAVDVPVTVAEDAEVALTAACADPDTDVVCVAGSLFLVADAMRWLAARGRLQLGVPR